MGARILVADDSVTIQKVVELTFSKEDFTLTQARNGAEAIRKAKEIRPDVILLDLVMPDKNGYEVCTALRAEPSLKGVPIILLAGTFESYDQERGKRAGASDFVTKPFESQALISKVKQALFARSLDAAAPPTLSLDEDTLKIPPAAVHERVAESTAPKTQVIPALSQDDLWQLLEAPDAPAAPAAPPAELSLDELSSVPPTPGPEFSALDLGALESAPTPPARPVPSEAAMADSLSLDDLLSAPAPTPPLSVEAEAAPSLIEILGDEGLPPLPMVEADKGEPPAFSIDDLLAAPEEMAAHAPEAASLEISELDLSGLREDEQAAPPVQEPIAPVSAGAVAEFSLEEIEAPELEALEAAPPAPVSAAELTAVLGVPEAIEPPPLESLESVMAAPAKAAPEVEAAAEAGGGAPADLAPSAVGEITRAVTRRVADELAKELKDTLIERVEKIVWEVVPDLAEILITKEIERIRRLAEEDKTA